MIRILLEKRIKSVLKANTGAYYPLIVGLLAFATAITLSLPFAGPLILSIFLAPQSSKRIVLFSSIGSALGASLLYLILHHGAWSMLHLWHPQIAQGTSWVSLQSWLDHYGLITLGIGMALPLPDGPMLAFLASHKENLIMLFIATFSGKFIKYSVYSYAVKTFPERFKKLGDWANR